MTKNDEVEKPILNDETFHNWKSHECTKALINLLNESKKNAEISIYETVISNKKIPVESLNSQKGALKEIYGMLESINGKEAKSILENFLVEEEDELQSI